MTSLLLKRKCNVNTEACKHKINELGFINTLKKLKIPINEQDEIQDYQWGENSKEINSITKVWKSLVDREWNTSDIVYVFSVLLMKGFEKEFSTKSREASTYYEIEEFCQRLATIFIHVEFSDFKRSFNNLSGAGPLVTKIKQILVTEQKFIEATFPSCMNFVTKKRIFRVGITLYVTAECFRTLPTDDRWTRMEGLTIDIFKKITDKLHDEVVTGKVVFKLRNYVTHQEHKHALLLLYHTHSNKEMIKTLNRIDARKVIFVPIAKSNVRFDVYLSWAHSSYRAMNFSPSLTGRLHKIERQLPVPDDAITKMHLSRYFMLTHNRVCFLEQYRKMSEVAVDILHRVKWNLVLGRYYKSAASAMRCWIMKIPRVMMNSRKPGSLVDIVITQSLWIEAIWHYYAATCSIIGGDYFFGLCSLKQAWQGMRRQLGSTSKRYAYFLHEAIHLSVSSIQFLPMTEGLLEELIVVLRSHDTMFKDIFFPAIENIKDALTGQVHKHNTVIKSENKSLNMWMNRKI